MLHVIEPTNPPVSLEDRFPVTPLRLVGLAVGYPVAYSDQRANGDAEYVVLNLATPSSGELLQIEVASAETSEAVLAATFKVLSDPRRFDIMRALMQAELCVCEVIDVLGVPQSLASHHLGVLRRAGLVRSRRDAQWVYYSVDPDWLRTVAREFRGLFDPTHLAPAALYGASTACAGVSRQPNAGPCCARHEHRGSPERGRVGSNLATGST